MPVFAVETASARYPVIVERGASRRAGEFLPARAGKLFVVTTSDVWRLHGSRFVESIEGCEFHLLTFPGGETNKRIAQVEAMAEEMVKEGGDRTSLVIAFGGGIVNDLGGFLAAVFMRGIPVLQVPTTLLAQVDAAVGGKTGANLVSGKNLVGAFHQPAAVLIDPDVLPTLPDREFRAGLAEVIKCGIIRSPDLFALLRDRRDEVLARDSAAVEVCIAEAVRIKCEVVSADEKESDLRRILNFGHTVGHAIEAETGYERLLHGEAVAWGMRAAARLAQFTGHLSAEDGFDILEQIDAYGPWPAVSDLNPDRLVQRLAHDKKTLRGAVHFVLPVRIGEIAVVSGIEETLVREAICAGLA